MHRPVHVRCIVVLWRACPQPGAVRTFCTTYSRARGARRTGLAAVHAGAPRATSTNGGTAQHPPAAGWPAQGKVTHQASAAFLWPLRATSAPTRTRTRGRPVGRRAITSRGGVRTAGGPSRSDALILKAVHSAVHQVVLAERRSYGRQQQRCARWRAVVAIVEVSSRSRPLSRRTFKALRATFPRPWHQVTVALSAASGLRLR